MDELKLLLELGPNLTEAGVTAFGFYVAGKLVTALIFGAIISGALIGGYKLWKRSIDIDEQSRGYYENKGKASA